jgi:hypothetical protein
MIMMVTRMTNNVYLGYGFYWKRLDASRLYHFPRSFGLSRNAGCGIAGDDWTIGMFLVFCLLVSLSVDFVFSSATSCLQLRAKLMSWSCVSHGRVPLYCGESWSCVSHGHMPLYFVESRSSSHGFHRVMACLESWID